jgi:hypothetical protein
MKSDNARHAADTNMSEGLLAGPKMYTTRSQRAADIAIGSLGKLKLSQKLFQQLLLCPLSGNDPNAKALYFELLSYLWP